MTAQQNQSNTSNHAGKWTTFFAMIATSIVTMFVLKYSNLYEADHVFFSQTRMWMSLMMGMAMIVIMLGFMWGMYKSLKTKIAVMVFAALGFVAFLMLARGQQTVGDEAWMKAMIPHHSIAIQTSSNATITDPRVRKLADEIIEAQLREIAEMKMLLKDIKLNGELGDGTALEPVPAKLTPELLEEAQKRVRSEGREMTPEIRDVVDIDE